MQTLPSAATPQSLSARHSTHPWSGTICTCKADADCKAQLVGHRCDAGLRACTCATDADCPAGKTCSGTFITIKICK